MSISTTRQANERVATIVREILKRRGTSRAIEADEDLRAAGLSSLDMVNLMLAVESELDLKIPDDAMSLANFRSIAAIDALVGSLTAAQPRAN
ncbi:MAG: acyl carrier protein [Hyphomicrobiales bacterium]|nr:acyl carrier protein [Hyphomicrobiales bacterium]